VAVAQQVADFKIGQKFQIILSAVPNLAGGALTPSDVPVWDIDLWDADNSTITGLHAAGRIVVCYFSAGTSEDWRSDYNKFSSSDKGAALPDWKGENWLRLNSPNVRSIMQNRIQMAASKGCDAIDPDNTGMQLNDFSIHGSFLRNSLGRIDSPLKIPANDEIDGYVCVFPFL